MNFRRHNGSFTVYDLNQFTAADVRLLCDEIRAAHSPGFGQIDINLSEIDAMDSAGLGALVSLYETIQGEGEGVVRNIRLLHPQPPVQQLLELARMHDVFEIVPAPADLPVLPAVIPLPVPSSESV